MRVLVVHASQFGATRGIADRITEALLRRGLRAESYPATELAHLAGANAIVIGSAIHAGHWLDDATRFVYRHQDELRQVPVCQPARFRHRIPRAPVEKDSLCPGDPVLGSGTKQPQQLRESRVAMSIHRHINQDARATRFLPQHS